MTRDARGLVAPRDWALLSLQPLCLVVDGATPRHETTVRLGWSTAAPRGGDEVLHVRFDVVDDHVVAPFENHDDPVFEADAVEVFLEPCRCAEARQYFEIDIAPNGTVFDALITNRTQPGDRRRDITTMADWNCVGLRCEVGPLIGQTGEGYAVEMAIPWRALTVPGNEAYVVQPEWSINLFRIDRSPGGDEYQAWRPTGLVDFHRPAAFGRLTFGDDSGKMVETQSG